MLHGQPVTYLFAEQRTLQYGRSRLRTMGIHRVYTRPGYRRRGFAAAIVHDALTAMMEQGAHLAMLYDEPGYLGRFGFSPVFPTYWLEFASAEASAIPPPLSLRAPQPADFSQMMALYERHWAGRVALVRSPETWTQRLQHDPERQVVVAVDVQDRVAGYIAGYDLFSEHIEILVDTPDAALTFASEAGRLYQRAGQDVVRWHVLPDDVLIPFVRPRLNITLSARYSAQGGWTARIIDAARLVDALLPEITSQARAALRDFKPDDLVFHCHPDVVQIGLRKRGATFSRLRHDDFIQVMFGSLSPTALGMRERLHPDAVDLLSALFPQRMAAVGQWDWF